MNRRLHALLMLMWCALAASAQNISVASFRLLETDLTANTSGFMERDQNGEVAALIKVVTSEVDFTFEGGQVGIVKTKHEPGEWWVYVPRGIKKITIKHPHLGVLRDYWFPIPIEQARTYEMVLTTAKVTTVVTHAVHKQYVVFNVNPADAVVELGDEELPVEDGQARKLVPYGTYNYRVSHPNYYTEAGQVIVGNDGKVMKDIVLRPHFGWIKIEGSSDYNDALVYIDDVRIGRFPLTSEGLRSGTHKVKVVKSMYKTYEQQVVVTDNATTTLPVELIPNFAPVTLLADEDCEIWIDGEQRAVERWSGPLEIGDYTVEVRRPSHRNASQIVHIGSTAERTIHLTLPEPIQATLDVSSSPSDVTVYIDGAVVGTTPLFVNEVLVGNHHLTFKKEGYVTMEQDVNVLEGVENSVSVQLSNTEVVSITSEPSGARVEVGGIYKGITPLSIELKPASYAVSLTKKGYYDYSGYLRVPSGSNQLHHVFNKIFLPPTNTHYKWLSIYLDGYGFGALASRKYAFDYGVGGGVYFGGFNVEGDWGLRYSGGVGSMGFRIGWGIECGDHWVLTPQIGVRAIEFSPMLLGDYYYTHGYYEPRFYTPYTFGCRVQYCLNRYFSLFVTPEYGYSPAVDALQATSTLQARAGVSLNLGGSNESFGNTARVTGKVLLTTGEVLLYTVLGLLVIIGGAY